MGSQRINVDFFNDKELVRVEFSEDEYFFLSRKGAETLLFALETLFLAEEYEKNAISQEGN